MLRQSEEIVARIKEASDIVSVIESYLPLRKRGKNYLACCPFHEEKTPSFNVNPERRIFKCFGCGKGGDVISFVQSYERVEFPQALEILAERAGISLGAPGAGVRDEKTLIRKALAFALEFFKKTLASPEGEKAREYLRRRKFEAATIADFGIGYAPAGWERLKTAAQKAGFSEEILLQAGLLVRNEQGRTYDRFRERITIPIFDTLKRPLGFGARVLDGGGEPKYLNSPETPLFRKGQLLYALEKVKNELTEGGKIRVVEGYTDVILSHQAGVKNLVATLGTSLTKEHAKLLSRYTRHVVLVYDGDEAGQKANARGVEILLEEDLDVSLVVLPDGMDPGDLIEKRTPEALREALQKEIDFFDFSLRRLTKQYDISSITGQAKAADECLRILSKLPSAVKRDLWFPRIADRLGIAEKALRERFRERKPVTPAPATAEVKRAEPSRTLQIEIDLLGVIWKDPSILPMVRQRVVAKDLRGPGHEALYEALLRLYEQHGTVALGPLEELAGAKNEFFPSWRERIRSWEAMEYEEPFRIAEQLLESLARRIRQERIEGLKNEAKRAQRTGDTRAAEQRFDDIHRILKESRVIHG